MIKKLCVSLLITALPAIALAEKDLDDLRADNTVNEWRLSKNDNRHKIKVYVKNEDGQSIRSFRVVATMDASIETLARVQSDFDNYLRWYFATLEVNSYAKFLTVNTFIIWFMTHRLARQTEM